MAHYSWIFPVYLKHVPAIAQRIKNLVSLWEKDRGTSGGAKLRLDRLEQLQEDLRDQLASIDEDWDKATISIEWSQTDAVGEKKAIARMVRDSKSLGPEALCKIEDFNAEEAEWGWHAAAVALQYQEWETYMDAEDTHKQSEGGAVDFAPASLNSCKQRTREKVQEI